MNFRTEEEDRTKVWMISRRAGPQQLYSNLHAEIVAGAVQSFPAQGKGRIYLPQESLLNGRSREEVPVPKCEHDGLSAPVY